MKKVSVIIPVYNTSLYLEEWINSVLNQTYKNLEIIIVNDHSTDNSLEIISKFKDKRIKIINLKKNHGVAYCRNKGVDKSSGDYICYIDSDDYWNLDKIEKQLFFIKDKAFIYSSYSYLKNGKIHKAKVPEKINYKQALKNTTIFTSTVMFNMSFLNKDDIYMPDIRRGQDTATWWQVLKKGITAYGLNESLVTYRIVGKSLSSNKIKALKRTWNIYKRENINVFQRCFYFLCYVFNAIKRRLF